MEKLFENYSDVVSVEDTMHMLRLGKSSVYGLLKTHQLRHVRVGRKYLIPKRAVIEFVNGICYNKQDNQ